ncbi:MAG: hypothetical protein RL117_854 [Verrucomicrobiota bacterium]
MMTRFAIALTGMTILATAGEVSFNRDIRPIFTKHCTSCHGGVKEAGNISLIYRERALGEGKSGERAIVPGKPDESELMRRIVSKDPDEVMPKPKHGPPLVEKEVALIRQWISEGAEWEELWSFMPIQAPVPPQVQKSDWVKSPLDAWVLANLEKRQWQPSPEAGKAEWLRRVSLDLIGLPPTPEEWSEFQNDSRPEAYEKVVDRLLASPHFGERWAVMWLDLARYSDTMGFEKDPAREIWPYRDWVIRAFNRDLPFDQFTLKQLAGDLLSNPEPDDWIATGFHRNTMNNTEGGTDDEEYRIAAVMDRINTTWTTWQATTFGCVQCHSHPYDPYPHEDYYRFMAFFDNTEDADLHDEFPKTKAAQDAAQQAEVLRLEKAMAEQRKKLNDEALAEAKEITDYQIPKSLSATASASTGRIEQQVDGLFVASGTNPTNSSYTLTYPATSFGAIRLDILPLSDDPKKWSGLAAVCGDFHVWLIHPDGRREQIKLREVIADAIAGPFDPNEAIRQGGPGFGDYPAQRGPRWCVIVPEQPVVAPEGSKLEISIFHAIPCNADNQPSILKRFRLSFSQDSRLVSWLQRPERAAQWAHYGSLQAAHQAIPGTMVPTIRERSDQARRDTRVFLRGNRMTRDESVQPGIPQIVRPPQKTERLSRKDMAEWLMSDSNPLTARVLANRLWFELFGLGIVETLEDFGTSGVPPTHPALLDHLAHRLRKDHHWRIKPFLREMVLSSTYRQQSKATPELIEKDPRNAQFTRGPRQRLTAEMVRDQALLVSGLLSRKTFGPSVFPPQPEGIWKSVYNGAQWTTSQGEDRYRRGIYTYSKRTSGYPSFLTFDAPSRDVCSPRRLGSNTPLQALVTLNDPAYIEMAQAFAKRMASQGGDLGQQLQAGYQWLTLQSAPPAVIDALRKLHADASIELASRPEEMKRLGASAEEAALVMVANTMFNLDSALNR